MARKIKTEKERRKSRKKIIAIVFIVVLLIVFVVLLIWKFAFNNSNTNTPTVIKVIDSDENFGYSLSDKDSAYYKKEYEVLKKIINASSIDEEEYAKQVAKMFVIDLYTIDTKVNKYDVGGIEFFYSDKKSMHEQKVMDNIYSNLEDDTYGDRNQELPVVKEVAISDVENISYKLGEKEVKGYLVKLNITYEKDLGYDKVGSVVVCKENGNRMSVVDFQATLSPEYDE